MRARRSLAALLISLALAGCSAPPRASVAARTARNGAPTLSGVTLTPASPRRTDTITAAVSDVTDPDGDAVSLRYSWYRNGVPIAGASGATLAAPLFGRGDRISVAVEPFDGRAYGTARFSGEVAVLNTPPSLAGVTLTPTSPRAGDTLTATPGEAGDADGDTVVLRYTWYRDGQVVAGRTGATLPAGEFAKGQRLFVSAEPFDGFESGIAQGSGDVTVRNAPPVFDGVTLSPAAPRRTDTLTAIPTGLADADGDAAAFRFTWFRDGIVLAGESGGTLPPGCCVKGQQITVSAEPFDGDEAGPAKSSPSVTVLNTPPLLTDAALSPASATTATTLTAVPGTATDADGDVVTLTYRWMVDGVSIPGQTTSTLAPAFFTAGRRVAATLTPSDGESDGPAVTTPDILIGGGGQGGGEQGGGGSAPVVSSVTIAPVGGGAVVHASVIDASVIATDPDGDPVTLTYQWRLTRGGATRTVGGNSARLDPGVLAHNDLLRLLVTPSDGTRTGPLVASNLLIVDNTPPTRPTVTLSAASPKTSDDLSCTAADSTDSDGEAVTYTFVWRRNGIAFGAVTQAGNVSTVAGGSAVAGAVFECAATPSDGASNGPASPTVSATYVGCGDGIVQAWEECEDGNTSARDGCSPTCMVDTYRSCKQVKQLRPEAPSGAFDIDPDGAGAGSPVLLWCDLTTDGGGWTLVAKVSHSNIDNISEPISWFTAGGNASQLSDAAPVLNAPPASTGAAFWQQQLSTATVARFTVVAADDLSQRASWFKTANWNSFSKWFNGDATPTLVCTDLAMTRNCSSATIATTGGSQASTALGGMDMAHWGYAPAGSLLHMRLDTDYDPKMSSICSSTLNVNGNAWRDSRWDHWGNGLLIYLR
jgi:cysteine-rich repeat protein